MLRRLLPAVLVALVLAPQGALAHVRGQGRRPPTTPVLPADCPATPCLVDRVVPLPASPSMGAVDPHVRVLLPSRYDGHRRLPVVYLLHGVGDTYKGWSDKTDVATFAASLGVIVVMPDGGHTPDSGWYSDWQDGSRRWETFHTKVLIPWVDAAFATAARRGHRAVVGLSMGGFGAVGYAARHPDLFGAAATFSGFLDTQLYGPVEEQGFKLMHPQFGTPDSRVWGDGTTNAANWSAHNPAALARSGALRHLAGNLWLATGTGTPGGPAGDDPTNPGSDAIEQFVWQSNQSFKLAMAQSSTPFHDLSYVGGQHTWPYWQWALHQVLPRVAAAISR